MENNLATSPTQLSLKKLRDEDWLVDIAERFIIGANIRKDLFGFGDLVALKPNQILLIQTTTAANISSRINKIKDHENVGRVRESGMMIHVHGWFQDDKRRWHCKVVNLS